MADFAERLKGAACSDLGRLAIPTVPGLMAAVASIETGPGALLVGMGTGTAIRMTLDNACDGKYSLKGSTMGALSGAAGFVLGLSALSMASVLAGNQLVRQAAQQTVTQIPENVPPQPPLGHFFLSSFCPKNYEIWERVFANIFENSPASAPKYVVFCGTVSGGLPDYALGLVRMLTQNGISVFILPDSNSAVSVGGAFPRTALSLGYSSQEAVIKAGGYILQTSSSVAGAVIKLLNTCFTSNASQEAVSKVLTIVNSPEFNAQMEAWQ